MYKVFINNRPVFLIDDKDDDPQPDSGMMVRFDGEATLRKTIAVFEGNPQIGSLTLIHENSDLMFKALCTLYEQEEAAGGVVQNEQGKTLFILRNGTWDLPKGHVEPGETPQEAAMREVREECGLQVLKIIRQLEPTYHTYSVNGRNFLKTTAWFLMNSPDNKEPHPQIEEGITEVRWVDRNDMALITDNTWGSIRELLSVTGIQ